MTLQKNFFPKLILTSSVLCLFSAIHIYKFDQLVAIFSVIIFLSVYHLCKVLQDRGNSEYKWGISISDCCFNFRKSCINICADVLHRIVSYTEKKKLNSPWWLLEKKIMSQLTLVRPRNMIILELTHDFWSITSFLTQIIER